MINWPLVRTLLLSVLTWIVKLCTPKTSTEKKEAKIESLVKEIETLTEKYDEAHKKWAVAAAIDSPDRIELWNEWLFATKNLARAEREYERLGGKASDIH